MGTESESNNIADCPIFATGLRPMKARSVQSSGHTLRLNLLTMLWAIPAWHSHAHIPARTSAVNPLIAFKSTAMGRDVLEVEAECFTAMHRAFLRTVHSAMGDLANAPRFFADPNRLNRHPGVLSPQKVIIAYGIGCSFADVAIGREWPTGPVQ
jgi:hypothetical protein